MLWNRALRGRLLGEELSHVGLSSMKAERGTGNRLLGEKLLHLRMEKRWGRECLLGPRWHFAGAEQVGEDTIGAGDQFGKLPVESVGHIDISPLAWMGNE